MIISTSKCINKNTISSKVTVYFQWCYITPSTYSAMSLPLLFFNKWHFDLGTCSVPKHFLRRWCSIYIEIFFSADVLALQWDLYNEPLILPCHDICYVIWWHLICEAMWSMVLGCLLWKIMALALCCHTIRAILLYTWPCASLQCIEKKTKCNKQTTF